MKRPQICLTLTGKTLQENLKTIEKYRKYIDMVELRGDFLEPDESLYMRKFPGMAGLPCILTIRRKIDGGQYDEGEASRTTLFARALSYADTEDKTKNFAYVDFEEDYHIPSLQDATLAFGTKIIRSVHDMKNPITNIRERLEKLQTSYYEIPKIAFMPHSLDDVTNLFAEAQTIKNNYHILVAMGPLGVPSRILSEKLNNYLTYCSAPESQEGLQSLSHLDPVTLNEMYTFKSIDKNTSIYGITGWPLKKTSSPQLHSDGYKKNKMNAVYVPVCAEKAGQAIRFADVVGLKGMSVTIPHKEEVIGYLSEYNEDVKVIGACNTIRRTKNGWEGFNTDYIGFARSLLEFTGLKNLKHKRVAIIGAGGAAKAIAYSVKMLGGKACIFNRSLQKAKKLAEKYKFKYEELSVKGVNTLKKYSSIIIQTTSVGMGADNTDINNDPINFYEFTGNEIVYDIIYVPEVTAIMRRAINAGCRVYNGYRMLEEQGYEQFKIFTGVDY